MFYVQKSVGLKNGPGKNKIFDLLSVCLFILAWLGFLVF
jgi:hypothetical protein